MAMLLFRTVAIPAEASGRRFAIRDDRPVCYGRDPLTRMRSHDGAPARGGVLARSGATKKSSGSARRGQ
jgi:hypothetical protein